MWEEKKEEDWTSLDASIPGLEDYIKNCKERQITATSNWTDSI